MMYGYVKIHMTYSKFVQETEDRFALERPVPSFDVHQEQQISTAPQTFIENAGNSDDQIIMSADSQVLNGSSGSSNDLSVSSNDLTVTHREASTDSSNHLSSIGPCSSQTEPIENGDCGPWRQVSIVFCLGIGEPFLMNT